MYNKYVKTYNELITEGDQEKLKAKDQSDGVKDLFNMQYLPKETQIKKLAQELYKAQYDVGVFKYKLADKTSKMKENGASEDEIAKMEEIAADQVANISLRVEAIQLQMVAIAADNSKLAMKADEMGQEATNIALRDVQKYYSDRAKKSVKKSEIDKLNKDKEAAQKELDGNKEEKDKKEKAK